MTSLARTEVNAVPAPSQPESQQDILEALEAPAQQVKTLAYLGTDRLVQRALVEGGKRLRRKTALFRHRGERDVKFPRPLPEQRGHRQVLPEKLVDLDEHPRSR